MLRFVFPVAVIAILLPATFGGCGPELSDEELGTIEYKIPKVPGADQRYVVEPYEDSPGERSGTEPDSGPRSGAEQSASPAELQTGN